MKKRVIILLSITILIVAILSQVTFFVVQPIGALPEGKTLVIFRLNKTKLIDSADAMCTREMGGVSLLCRGAMIAAVAKNSTILIRLPYSEFLYSISTNGNTYSR